MHETLTLAGIIAGSISAILALTGVLIKYIFTAMNRDRDVAEAARQANDNNRMTMIEKSNDNLTKLVEEISQSHDDYIRRTVVLEEAYKNIDKKLDKLDTKLDIKLDGLSK